MKIINNLPVTLTFPCFKQHCPYCGCILTNNIKRNILDLSEARCMVCGNKIVVDSENEE